MRSFMSKFGWCAGYDHAATLKQAGYDYMEGGISGLKLEESGWEERLASYRDSGLPPLAWNLFLPGDLRIVGPEMDEERIRRYVDLVAKALHSVGAQIAVLGSGRSRNVPDDWERSRAEAQILWTLDRIADAFAGTGVTLAIEPLNRKESNIINSVAEGVEYARQINRAPIRVLADFYHMDEESEPLDTLVANRDWLAHIHVADTGRYAPGTGSYPYAEFVGQLRQAGYTGLVSVECRSELTPETAAASLSFLRQAWG